MSHHVAEKEHTHVLIIGNGFDIEHGLKTKYTDFFINRGPIGNTIMNNVWQCPDPMVFPSGFFYSDIFSLYNENMPHEDIFYKDIISYFKMSGNWFVLEEVIYLFVKGLNKEVGNPTKTHYSFPNLLEEFRGNITKIKDINIVINKTYEHLRHCTQNLHDYLCEQYEDVTENLRIIVKNPLGKKNIINGLLGCWVNCQEEGYPGRHDERQGTIERLERDEVLFEKKFEEYVSSLKKSYTDRFNRSKKNSKFQFFLKEIVNKHKLMVLNFNYTKVFEKLYEDDLKGIGYDIKHHHIHGCINVDHLRVLQRLEIDGRDHHFDINKINLVLGCQSFKSEDDICSFFNVFTKAKQRKRYGTIEGYEEFLSEFKKCQNITFHIIGHSLDEVDHDILKEVLGFRNSRIRVYYHNQEARERLENNIIKIIGKEDVEKRVEFIYQYHPQEGVFPSDALNIG